MTNKYKELINQHQASSLKQVLEEALNYHFENFARLEKLGEPFSMRDRMKIVEVTVRMKANMTIKFEVQAYINHLRRLKHFIKYLQRNGGFEEPREPELRQIWRDIMEKDGVVNVLANKWAVHRSVDDPRGESESLHLGVLLNLEGTVTMWGNGHMFLAFDKYEFYLFHYHQRALKFVNWVFDAVESNENK